MKRCYSRAPVVDNVVQSPVQQEDVHEMPDATAAAGDDLLQSQVRSADDALELAVMDNNAHVQEKPVQVKRPRRVIRLPARFRC